MDASRIEVNAQADIPRTVGQLNAAGQANRSDSDFTEKLTGLIHAVSSPKPGTSATGLDHLYRVPHKEFGFDVPGGCVGLTEFENLNDVIKRIDPSKPIILNVGDSSTAGYNAEALYTGKRNIDGILFGYKTYSGSLNEDYPNNVINAGVPGATSYQVRKKLKWILEELTQKGLKPSCVTIYVGNVDGRYGIEHKCWIDQKPASSIGSGVKVTPADYKENLSAMISDIRNAGSTPILIRPISNLYAEPLLVTRTHREDPINQIDPSLDTLTRLRLEQAKRAWSQGKFADAVELDTKLCRIKQPYINGLKEVAAEKRVHLIDLQNQLNIRSQADADKYFMDYCHINDRTHLMIADAIREIINSGKQYSEPSFADLASKPQRTSLGTRVLLALATLFSLIVPASTKEENDANYPHF